MFILYTVAPILYRMASSAYYNLSLLSSDFYGLIFGLGLFVRTFSVTTVWIPTYFYSLLSITHHTGSTSLPM
jgi:hypothetical protein